MAIPVRDELLNHSEDAERDVVVNPEVLGVGRSIAGELPDPDRLHSFEDVLRQLLAD